jgi:NADH-quinone oxidoreductase subunit D
MAEAALRNSTINFGAPHPAARLCPMLELDGEIAERVDPRIGVLLSKALPYFNRLDYVAPMNREHAFCVAAERLLGINSQARPAHPTANPARPP